MIIVKMAHYQIYKSEKGQIQTVNHNGAKICVSLFLSHSLHCLNKTFLHVECSREFIFITLIFEFLGIPFEYYFMSMISWKGRKKLSGSDIHSGHFHHPNSNPWQWKPKRIFLSRPRRPPSCLIHRYVLIDVLKILNEYKNMKDTLWPNVV